MYVCCKGSRVNFRVNFFFGKDSKIFYSLLMIKRHSKASKCFKHIVVSVYTVVHTLKISIPRISRQTSLVGGPRPPQICIISSHTSTKQERNN